MWFWYAGTNLSKRRGASVFGVGNCVEANTEHTGMGRRAVVVGERLFHVGSPTFSRLSPIRFDAGSVPVLLVPPQPQFRSYWFSHGPSSGTFGSTTSSVPVLLVLLQPSSGPLDSPTAQFPSYCFFHVPSSGSIGAHTAQIRFWFYHSPVPVLLVLPHSHFRSYWFSHNPNSVSYIRTTL